MPPKRRAAIASLCGATVTDKEWYTEFDPHHESWYIISDSHYGARASSSYRTHLPIFHECNWYMSLYKTANVVKKLHHDYIDDCVLDMLKGKKKSFKDSIQLCINTDDNSIMRLEEVVMLLFYNVFKTKSFDEISEAYENDKERQKVVDLLKKTNFSLEPFLKLIADQHVRHAARKRANEMYSWGDVVRRKEEEKPKHKKIADVGLAIVAGVLLASSIPLMIIPPVGILPLAAGTAIGVNAIDNTKSAGLIGVVIGCLQQRLAIAFHEETLEPYY